MPRPKRMNGEGTVRKRPDGRYEARVLLQDGRRISVYGKTAREVTREIRAIKVRHDSGQPLVRNEERVGTFLETWLEHEIKRRRRAQTYAPYAQMVRRHMLRELGSIKLTELSARRVQAWLGAKQHAGIPPRTVPYVRDILRPALSPA